MIGQLSTWGIIRFGTKQIKKLRIHDSHKEVECGICIGDDYEKRTQLITELIEVQLIVGGDLQDLIYCKRRESCRTANKDRLSRFSGSELIRLELFECKCTQAPLFGIGFRFKDVTVISHDFGIFVLCAVQPALYDLKLNIYRILELLIVLTALRIVDHVDQRFKIPLIFGVHSKYQGDICRVKELFSFYPKVIAGRLLR